MLRLADRVDDVRYDDTQDCVNGLVKRMRDGFEDLPSGKAFRPTSIVIVVLDESGRNYNLRTYCSNMDTTDVVHLLDFAHHKELKELLG